MRKIIAICSKCQGTGEENGAIVCRTCQGNRVVRKMVSSQPATVIDEIAAERAHQITKGYDAAHDDNERNGQIIVAALACLSDRRPPWCNWNPPADHRQRLVVAAALLVAEIERWDRAFGKPAALSHS